MPRFFFNIVPGVIDKESEECSSEAAARKEALESSREILREGALAGWDMTDWKMTVTDEKGHAVFEVPITVPALAT
jgi:hypothetical protein